MAIFGALNELPLPEVLTMLGRRSGKLKLWNLSKGKVCELHLNEGRLKAMVVNRQIVPDIMSVREEMIELIDAEQGNFEFERHPPDTLLGQLNIPLEQLLLSTATAVDELKAYRTRFADKRTRFQSAGPVDMWLDEGLYSFWQRADDYLEHGVSAEDLSQRLGMSLEMVQLNLYKLRSLGKVAPVRAYQEQAELGRSKRPAPTLLPGQEAPPPPSPRVEKEKPGLVGRLLNAITFGRRS